MSVLSKPHNNSIILTDLFQNGEYNLENADMSQAWHNRGTSNIQ